MHIYMQLCESAERGTLYGRQCVLTAEAPAGVDVIREKHMEATSDAP